MHVSHAEDLYFNAKPRDFTFGQPLQPGTTIGGYPIWMGEGKWQLFDVTRRESTTTGQTAIPLGTAYFFQTEGKKWIATMSVDVNLRNGHTFWLGEPCKRDDMLFKLQLRSGREDNCATINHVTHYLSEPQGKYAELLASFKEQGIEIPSTVLHLLFTRNGLEAHRLVYSIWINPEVLGFAPENEPAWGRNPWNKAKTLKDPAKKQFIDALSAWATDFVNHMDAGLKQKPDAFATVPSWRTVLTSAQKP